MKYFLLFLVFHSYATPTIEELDDKIKDSKASIIRLEAECAVIRNQLQKRGK